jgi:hypothetical protein
MWGDESPIYSEAAGLWKERASSLNGWKLVLVKSDLDSPMGFITSNGIELTVGSGIEVGNRIRLESHFLKYRQWSLFEQTVYLQRDLMAYKYLLETQPRPFILLACTATSVINFHHANALIPHITHKGLYAGKRIFARDRDGNLQSAVSGAAIWMSCDTVEHLINNFPTSQLDRYSDLWIGQQLSHLQQVEVSSHSIIWPPPSSQSDRVAIESMIRNAFSVSANYHVRIKTENDRLGRHLTDDVSALEYAHRYAEKCYFSSEEIVYRLLNNHF